MSDRDQVADDVRTRVLSKHEEVAIGVLHAAEAVADTWLEDWTTSRAAIVQPLRSELRTRGVLEQFPGVLSDAVQAAGYDLQATPVAAPPYVIVTSRGPILRATVHDGRLVAGFHVFTVDRRTPPRYYRSGETARGILSVEILQAGAR